MNSDEKEIVHIFRLIEYAGPRFKVEMQIARSVHGTKDTGLGVLITAVTLGEFTRGIEDSRAAATIALLSAATEELRSSTKQRDELELLLEDAQAEIAKLKEEPSK